jgi:hypothetical protein
MAMIVAIPVRLPLVNSSSVEAASASTVLDFTGAERQAKSRRQASIEPAQPPQAGAAETTTANFRPPNLSPHRTAKRDLRLFGVHRGKRRIQPRTRCIADKGLAATSMGFIKRFLTNVLREEQKPKPKTGGSFQSVTDEALEAHLDVVRYGNFLLTDAVRPSYDLQIVPTQGFRHDVYNDAENKSSVPVLMGAASNESLFELFLELLDPLGFEVDVVLETSHRRNNAGHTDLYREHIDLPVLKSILYEYEDLLLNDGCTGIAVLNPNIPQEVQFDEHKLLIVYGDNLGDYESIFQSSGVPCKEEMKFITEAEHVHSSSDYYRDQFEELKMRLGMDSHY